MEVTIGGSGAGAGVGSTSSLSRRDVKFQREMCKKGLGLANSYQE